MSGFNLFIAYKFENVAESTTYTKDEIDRYISAVWAQVKPGEDPVYYTGKLCTEIYPDDTTTV